MSEKLHEIHRATPLFASRPDGSVAAGLVGTHMGLTSAYPVRRDKAALSSGCKTHPATAPAGSNRSSYGGDEVAEAFG